MWKRKNFSKFKNSVLSLVSGVAFLVLVWALFYGKFKASAFLSPIFNKIPQDEAGLMKATENILGEAVEKIRGENTLKSTVQKGSEFFEESEYAEPAREMREEIKSKIDETIESAKELPAKELKSIQRQVCREWLGDEIATESSER